jgi:hypothetical protein
MPDKRTRSADGTDASGDPRRPPSRLIHEVRESLRATTVYACALSDRFELACAFDPAQLDDVPAELLVHLEAVSEAFQDGASHTLWYIAPELARCTRTVAGLARAGAGDPPAEDG